MERRGIMGTHLHDDRIAMTNGDPHYPPARGAIPMPSRSQRSLLQLLPPSILPFFTVSKLSCCYAGFLPSSFSPPRNPRHISPPPLLFPVVSLALRHGSPCFRCYNDYRLESSPFPKSTPSRLLSSLASPITTYNLPVVRCTFYSPYLLSSMFRKRRLHH